MIIVALVATMASAMIWQQYRAVQVEAAERARAQATWILAGALDFAKLILREDFKTTRGAVTAATQPWATPLAESRLNSFLAVDKSNIDNGPDAFLSGSITDAQGKFNVRNLVKNDKGAPQIDADSLKALEKICDVAGIETGVATRIAEGLLGAVSKLTGKSIGGSDFLMPETISQLTWFGIDISAIDALRPYAILLREPTALNVNTAPREVLAAVMPQLDAGSIEMLLQVRQRKAFESIEAFIDKAKTLSQDIAPPDGTVISVKSSYFEVSGRLRTADRVLIEQSLVERLDADHINVLQTTRTASLEQLAN